MPHNPLESVSLSQLVTLRTIQSSDQHRTIKSIVYTVIPFDDNVPFWGKEIRQITELSNGERTTQIRIGTFLYKAETQQLFLLQGNCETNCKTGSTLQTVIRTGRFDKHSFLESYPPPQMPPWPDNEKYLIDLPFDQFTYKELRNDNLYFFKKGIFHHGHFLEGLWIEYVPGHSLGDAAFLRAYKGKISAKLGVQQVWQESFHDEQGICFLKTTDGIKMYEGFKDHKPSNKWFYTIQLQNGQVHSLRLQGNRTPWTLIRLSDESYDFSYDTAPVYDEYESSCALEVLALEKIVVIQKLLAIEADLLQFELVRPYVAPESCTVPSITSSSTPLKQLILMYILSGTVKGHLIQGDMDDKGLLQGEVVLDEIKREDALIRVEGLFLDGNIVRGKVTERRQNMINILEGRFNESHFFGTFTVINPLNKEKTVYSGKFRRRHGGLTFDVDVGGITRIADINIKKYDISTPEDRLFYDYQGEVECSFPYGKGILTCWNKENTLSCNVRGNFIKGAWQVGGQMIVNRLQSTSMPDEYDISVHNDRTLLSITSVDLSSGHRTTRWTLTRNPNGKMYYTGLNSKGLIQTGPEIDCFKSIETELLALITLHPFVPREVKESVAQDIFGELSALANEEERKQQEKNAQRREAAAQKAQKDALDKKALEDARRIREAQRKKDSEDRREKREAQLRLEQQEKERIEMEQRARRERWRAENMVERMTQTSASYLSIKTEEEYFDGAVYTEDELVERVVPTQREQSLKDFYTKTVLEGLSRGPGEWFYAYKKTDSEGNIHQVRKYVQNIEDGGTESFLMLLQDIYESDDSDEYVLMMVSANRPLLKGCSFTGSATVVVINKKTELITEYFDYQGDFLCTESFYEKIGDELNFEFRRGLRTTIDVAKDVVIEQEGTFDSEQTPICIKPAKRYSIREWEAQSNKHVQLEHYEASRNPYGFYAGRKTALPDDSLSTRDAPTVLI